MLDFLDLSTAERLVRADYRSEFWQRRREVGAFESWKLERQQHFQEPPGTASWEAFVQGRWDEAMRLIEADRDRIAVQFQGDAVFHRVRVVEQPIVPYLHWELCLLRVRAQCGELIRVVGPEKVKPWEDDGPLPELINVGTDTLYRIIYDDVGAPDGAQRISDAGAVAAYIAFMEPLWSQGEDVIDFFDREVAHMEPPGAQ